MARVVAQRLGPGVERGIALAPVRVNPGLEIVTAGERRIPLQPSTDHSQRGIQLTPAPQRLTQIEKDQAVGLGGELGSQGSNVVSHGAARMPSAMTRAASRSRTTVARCRSSSAGRPGKSSQSLQA